jgi:hypothetical protein
MSTSVPDSISFEQLAGLIDDAPIDIVDQVNDDNELDEFEVKLNEAMEAFEEIADDAMTAKAAVQSIVARMFDWHTAVAEKQIKEGDTDCAIGWARDAGKFQAVMNILLTISVGPDDPTCTNV